MLSQLNPLTKLVIVCAFTIAAVWTLEPQVLLALLGLELVAIPFLGLGIRAVAIRVLPLLVIAVVLIGTNALFSRIAVDPASDSWSWAWGPFSLSITALVATAPIGLRLLVLAIPAVLLLGTTDPTELADSLIQHLKLPSRYALSMVIGLQLLPQLQADWIEQTAALRARGIDTRNPVTAGRLAPSRLVGLLIFAIRRATRAATTMTAKGYEPYAARSAARVSVIRVADYVVAITCLVVVGMILIAL